MDNIKVYNKPNLKQTVSSFKNDRPKRRDEDIRRDNDKFGNREIGIQDVDEAIILYLRNELKPQISRNDKLIEVPVIWLNAEKNKDFTSYGYIRDDKGKIQSPLIALRKNSIEKHEALYRTNQSDFEYYFVQKYSPTNRYYNFKTLQNEVPKKEVYGVKFPSFVHINYNLIIQTDLEKDADILTKKIIEFEGNAFGDTNGYKFTTYIDDYEYNVINDINDDRIVSVEMSLRTFAYLVNGDLIKRITPSKIVTRNK